MKPLPELKASWDNASKSIRLTWNGERMGNARFIYLVPLVQQTAESRGVPRLTVDPSVNQVTLDLQANPAVRSGKYNWTMQLFTNDLMLRRFMAYSEEYANPVSYQTVPDLLAQRRDLISSVMVGQACIEYSVSYKKLDKSIQTAFFTIRCDREIEGACLSYSYQIGDKTLSIPLPLNIHKGKVKTPTFLTPAGAEVQLTAARENLSGVLSLQKKSIIL